MAAEVVPASVWEQIPVIVLFGLFCVLLLRGFQKFISDRDKVWADQAGIRDAQWQEFLQKQRQRDGESLTAVVNTLNVLVNTVRDTNARNEERYADLNKRIAIHHTTVEGAIKNMNVAARDMNAAINNCGEVRALRDNPDYQPARGSKRK